jgi:hypothetical protein
MPAGGLGIGPDGKELRAQISGTSFIEADVADVFGSELPISKFS